MIGLMGGTFNPVHYGHLIICEGIREEFKLEKVIFIPAKIPPHKTDKKIAEAYDRLKMVRLAIADNPFFEASDIEMKRDGSSYTVDTLMAFKRIYGSETRLGLIVGADSLVQIETWRNFNDIFRLADIIVAPRPDTQENHLDNTIIKLKSNYGAKIFKFSGKAMNFSSTDIRKRIEEGLSIRYLVPPPVEAYIKRNGLYIKG
ncbi:MAG TPA: nicotinate-nucleotide adenylyltransferase [Clostridiaceae bacterium]|nr:nicotinate-nucleotide adenylyltransferase [Clostridiaceae bacterium]